MRRGASLLVLVAFLAPAACSSSNSGQGDSLRGISTTSSASLCKSYFASAKALSDARNTFKLDGIDAAAENYAQLAKDARRAGAGSFASQATAASEAAHALADYARRPIASGATAAASSESGATAPLMTIVLRVQLPETQMALACYSRGRTPFES